MIKSPPPDLGLKGLVPWSVPNPEERRNAIGRTKPKTQTGREGGPKKFILKNEQISKRVPSAKTEHKLRSSAS